MTSMWDRTARRIEADALEDLEGNKKFRSPAGQKFVRELRRYHNDRTEPLIPWLAREYRKGRLRHGVPLEEALERHPVGRAMPDPMKDALREYDRYHIGALPEPPQVEGADLGDLHHSITQWGNTAVAYNTDPEGEYLRDPVERWQTLTPDALNHWADWFHQPDRRKVPLDQLKAHDLPAEVQRYEREKARRMKDEAVEEGRHQGEVAHQWPDGWNVRSLPHGKALDFEAWHMRGDPDPRDPSHPDGAPICVNWPEYQRHVEGGDKLIYSLRDPAGKPHVTMEINPSRPKERIFGPAEVETALETDPTYSKWSPQMKQRVRDYMRRIDYDIDKGRHIDAPPPEDENLWSIAWDLRDSWSRHRARPEEGEIVQIQGKGNSVPKPEYQARMKDWFQTFPEEERPNWNWTEGDIEHIGALHPEAESWDPHYGVGAVGEPGVEEPDGDMGGYGPHGDYGLVKPHRKINYESVVESLVRPRTYHEYREGDHSDHDDDEIHSLYREALRRGEMPELGAAVEKYGEKADESLHELEDLNYDYMGAYPGESWDEDPDQWREQYEQEHGVPVEEDHEDPDDQEEALKSLWEEQHRNYEWNREELYKSHKPSQLADALRKTVAPHFYPPDAHTPNYHYRNEPQHPTVIEHLQPNTNGLTVGDLPEGSYYATQRGTVGQKADAVTGRYLAEHVPTHVSLPGQFPPAEPQPQATLARVAVATPFRLLWAFAPGSGRTHLYDESEHHPAEAPTHETIARDLGEVGMSHGYAYSIPGGWRVLDYHHQPVADPFVRRQVVDRLRKR
jgi:hypothetical protein